MLLSTEPNITKNEYYRLQQGYQSINELQVHKDQ